MEKKSRIILSRKKNLKKRFIKSTEHFVNKKKNLVLRYLQLNLNFYLYIQECCYQMAIKVKLNKDFLMF